MMRRIVGAGIGLVAMVSAVSVGTVPAEAATSGTVGADISWPQCSSSGSPSEPPAGSAVFGIVGATDGRPGTANPCLGAEYSWANALTPSVEPQLYVNTADPGNTAADWPAEPVASGPADPYGTCGTVRSRGKTVGADDEACAFEYGVEQAQADLRFSAAANAPTTTWWLDVETANTWQTRSLIGLNQAVLDGMDETFVGAGAAVGIYCTHYQWGKIVGTLSGQALTDLGGVPQWIPGATSETVAASDCTDPQALPSFNSGQRVYVQYTATFDYDVAC